MTWPSSSYLFLVLRLTTRQPLAWCGILIFSRLETAGVLWRLLIEEDVILRDSPGHDTLERDSDSIRVWMVAWLIAWWHSSQANVDTHAMTT